MFDITISKIMISMLLLRQCCSYQPLGLQIHLNIFLSAFADTVLLEIVEVVSVVRGNAFTIANGKSTH